MPTHARAVAISLFLVVAGAGLSVTPGGRGGCRSYAWARSGGGRVGGG